MVEGGGRPTRGSARGEASRGRTPERGARGDTDRGGSASQREADRQLAALCARLAQDRQARDVRLLHVGDRLAIAEYFVLATVNNRRQARAIRDAIRGELKSAGAGVPRAASEDPDGRWSLYDYGAVIVHLFDDEGRRYFDLDGRWKDAPEEGFEAPASERGH
ncbi:MAG: ribosome silencing factor [Planctomycetota bacterium]